MGEGKALVQEVGECQMWGGGKAGGFFCRMGIPCSLTGGGGNFVYFYFFIKSLYYLDKVALFEMKIGLLQREKHT